MDQFKRRSPLDLELPLILDKHMEMTDVGSCSLCSSLHSHDAAETFKQRFNTYCCSLLDDLDTTNLVFAGGAVLKCLMKKPADLADLGFDDEELEVIALSDFEGSPEYEGDIDIFIVGLTAEEAKAKVEEVGTCMRRNGSRISKPDILAVRSQYCITFVRGFPARHVQIILHAYRSPLEVVSHFDIDACCVLYDGQDVFCNTRGRRALNYRVNIADTHMRGRTYEKRLLKYSKRGFGLVVPGFDPERQNPELTNATEYFWEKEQVAFRDSRGVLVRINGLAKLLVMSNAQKGTLPSTVQGGTTIVAGQEIETESAETLESGAALARTGREATDGTYLGVIYDSAVRLPFAPGYRRATKIRNFLMSNLQREGKLDEARCVRRRRA
jgi:hypothetical protein